MDDVKKRALLVSALGSRAIDILSGRCAPRKVKELTYSQAIEILEEFYAPRPNEIAESFKFFTRVQKEEESAQEFIVELRQLADKCNFGDMLDRMLRDKIVCGVKNIDVQKAQLSRPKLTLQETENIVLAAEAARQGVKLMKPSDVKSEPELHKLAGKQRPGPSRQYRKEERGPSLACERCGSKEHSEMACTFKYAKCFQCGKKGHIAIMCRFKGKRQQRTFALTENSAEDGDTAFSSHLRSLK